MKIGDRLKAERLRLGLSQAEMAERAGVSKTTQFNYEKGDRSPDADYLSAMYAAGADVMYIVTGQRSLAASEGLASAEVRLLEQFRHLLPEDQVAVQRHVLALALLKTQPA